MTRYLLDTNIICNAVKTGAVASPTLPGWGVQRDDHLYIASLTVAEIQCGILEKPAGGKKR